MALPPFFGSVMPLPVPALRPIHLASAAPLVKKWVREIASSPGLRRSLLTMARTGPESPIWMRFDITERISPYSRAISRCLPLTTYINCS